MTYISMPKFVYCKNHRLYFIDAKAMGRAIHWNYKLFEIMTFNFYKQNCFVYKK